MSSLTLDELALLPLCGLLAYRAVRTFIFAFSSSHDGRPPPEAANYSAPANTGTNHSRPLLEHEKGYKRRALVLRGHDGIGAMAVQMLVQRGWRVSVHVPFSSVPAHTPQEVSERFMHVVEQRAREWGADEVIFDDGEEGGMDEGRGAAVRVLESLREDGDVFDAVLDTVGGKIVWAAAERLLKFQGSSTTDDTKPSIRRRGVGQFTTLVGHTPERVIPTARDNFRAGLRALRMGSANGNASAGAVDGGAGSDTKGHGKVGYAWVSVAQDVDWEGDDVSETLGSVLRLALDKGVRPLTDSLGVDGMRKTRIVPFEQAPYLFVDNGPLTDGGAVVVAVA
ncbi:hypothetical protein BDN70DRAFT_904942 [Pholiota conissans]|uniref:Uncharacterized protein n=1 Tax=Pholiota conissans TaxID=109636 RepID=A0A9P6CVN5_9AGAR|nr:hypothetical protein BDN70DRAFT_904942 [Pholiota conissans]